MHLQRFFLNRHVIVVGMLLTVMLPLALPSSAQEGVIVVANANLSLRASADRDSAQLGTVPYNTELAATAISADRNWVAVVYNGQGGWLSLAYTGVVSGSLGALNISNQTFTAGGTGAVTSSVTVATTINLRYRANPTLDEQPAGAIPFQTQLPALALSVDGLFVLVHYNGQNVWVYREYVQEISGSLSSFVPGAAPTVGEAPAAPASGSVVVEARDEFDGPNIDYPWGTYSNPGGSVFIENGQLVVAGPAIGCCAGASRNGIGENEGALLLFQYDTGTIYIGLDYSAWENSDYHRWQIARHWENWHIASQYGGRNANYTYYQEFPLTPNTWYYLLFRVGEHGQFYTQVWPRDNPSAYIVNTFPAPAGSGWDDQTWSVTIQVCNGTARFDSYAKLLFPANYETPATPPAY